MSPAKRILASAKSVRTMGRKERMGWGILGIVFVMVLLSFVLALKSKLNAEWSGIIGSVSLLLGAAMTAFCGADGWNTTTALKHGKTPPEGVSG